MADPTDARNVLLNRLADEFAARHRAGDRPRLEDYCDHHPELACDIRSLFPALAELERAGADAGPELAVEAADLPPVTELGDFRLLREVGRGGMGVVYEAEQVSLGRRVAIKLLPAGVFRDPAKRKRFEREAKAAARLHHTNIVPVHGYGEHAGTPYYVMQFIPGLGLDAVIDEVARSPGGSGTRSPTRPPTAERSAPLSIALAHSLLGEAEAGTVGWNPAAADAPTMTAAGGLMPDPTPIPGPDRSAVISVSASDIRLPGQSEAAATGPAGRKGTYWQSVARIGVQVAGALAYAHKLGVLHRDIKPSNLLLDLDGTVWVTDFGLAKADDSEDLTHTGDLLGTLRYMPPEAFEGKADARGDIYALGLTLFELVALRPAYDERERNKLVKQVTTGEPPRLRRLRPDAPRDLVTIVEKAIDRDPARRYQTAGALADDLQRFLDGRPIQARRATELEKLWMWARRRPAIAALLGLVLVSLAGGTVVSTTFAFRAADNAKRADKNAGELAMKMIEANSARSQAELQAGVADDARRNLAVTLTDSYLTLARTSAEVGSQAEAVLWFAHAAAKSEGDPERQRVGRVSAHAYQHRTFLPVQAFHTQTIFSRLEFHPGGRFLLGSGGRFWLWDLDREAEHPLPPGTTAVAFSPDGRHLAAGTGAGRVILLELPSGRESLSVEADGGVSALAFSPDGKKLVVCDNRVRLFEVEARAFVGDGFDHPGRVVAAEFAPDGQSLFTTAADRSIRLHAAGGECRLKLPPPSGPKPSFGETAARFVDSGQSLLVVVDGIGPAGYETATGRLRFRGARQNVYGLGTLSRGAATYTAELGGVYKWSLASAVPFASPEAHYTHDKTASTVVPTADGRGVLTGVGQRSVRLLDSSDLTLAAEPLAHPCAVRAMACSADTTRIATAVDNGLVRVWAFPKCWADPVVRHGGRMSLARVARDGRLAVPTGGAFSDTTLQRCQPFDPATGTPVGPALDPGGLVLDADVSPDGGLIAVASTPHLTADARRAGDLRREPPARHKWNRRLRGPPGPAGEVAHHPPWDDVRRSPPPGGGVLEGIHRCAPETCGCASRSGVGRHARTTSGETRPGSPGWRTLRSSRLRARREQ
jgi:WD40 repeat protein